MALVCHLSRPLDSLLHPVYFLMSCLEQTLWSWEEQQSTSCSFRVLKELCITGHLSLPLQGLSTLRLQASSEMIFINPTRGTLQICHSFRKKVHPHSVSSQRTAWAAILLSSAPQSELNCPVPLNNRPSLTMPQILAQVLQSPPFTLA